MVTSSSRWQRSTTRWRGQHAAQRPRPAQFWPAQWVAVAGLLFLTGRTLYWRSYVRKPETRHLGTVLTMAPIAALLVAP